MSESDDINSSLSALQDISGRDRIESLDELMELMTADLYTEIKTAIELGKWPDGAQLSGQQLEYCMQLLILYENKAMPQTQRTGFNVPAGCGKKAGLIKNQ